MREHDLPSSAGGTFQVKGTRWPEWLETIRWRVLGDEVVGSQEPDQGTLSDAKEWEATGESEQGN